VLHRKVVDVKKSLDAVGQTCFLGLVELGVLDGTGDALGPAHLRQAVSLGLDLRTLLLVGEKLAKLGAVLVVELLKVGVVNVELLCAHIGGCIWVAETWVERIRPVLLVIEL
jgi:hypothetical protein